MVYPGEGLGVEFVRGGVQSGEFALQGVEVGEGCVKGLERWCGGVAARGRGRRRRLQTARQEGIDLLLRRFDVVLCGLEVVARQLGG